MAAQEDIRALNPAAVALIGTSLIFQVVVCLIIMLIRCAFFDNNIPIRHRSATNTLPTNINEAHTHTTSSKQQQGSQLNNFLL